MSQTIKAEFVALAVLTKWSNHFQRAAGSVCCWEAENSPRRMGTSGREVVGEEEKLVRTEVSSARTAALSWGEPHVVFPLFFFFKF